MASSTDYDLLTEHFGYPPVALLDDIINTVNVLADRALDSVERLLLSLPPANLGFRDTPTHAAADLAKAEIENGTHQLETLLNASIDKNFDLFELYAMRNILTVRPEDQPFMRLAHYEGLVFDEDGRRRDGGAADEESVAGLRRRVHASQQLHVALERERRSNDAVLEDLRRMVGVTKDGTTIKLEEEGAATAAAAGSSSNAESGEEGAKARSVGSHFGFLRNKGSLEDGGTERPITTTTEFTLSQLQSLRALSTSLREILPGLAGPGSGEEDVDEVEGAAKSWRRQRVAYIEAASRRYLERQAGLDLGEQGEVQDGGWHGEERGFGRDQVEGLERVAALLGEGAPRRSQSEPPRAEPTDQ